MKKIAYLLSVMFLTAIISCTQNGKKDETDGDSTQTAEQSENITEPDEEGEAAPLAWSFETVENEDGTTTTNVFIEIEGKKHPVLDEQSGTFQMVDKEAYADLNIPEDAAIAAMNYWNRVTTVIYAKKEDSTVLVKTGYKYDEDGAEAEVNFEQEMKIE